jgi:hypothetical protein
VKAVNELDWPQTQTLGDPWKDYIQFEKWTRNSGTKGISWIIHDAKMARVEQLRKKVLAIMQIPHPATTPPPTEAQATMLQDQVLGAYKYELVKVTQVKVYDETSKADEICGIHVGSGIEISLNPVTVLKLSEDDVKAGVYVVFVEPMESSGTKYSVANLFRVCTETVHQEFGEGLDRMKECLGHYHNIRT